MKNPEILGVEVETPDGRGSILTLSPGRVIIRLNCLTVDQQQNEDKLIGRSRGDSGLSRSYDYGDVEIIKGQYRFKPSLDKA